jgi:hypothetical protein
LELVKEIYTDATHKVSTINGETNVIPIRRGVRQGDPLSPLLFNLAIEPLIRAVLAKRATSGHSFGPLSVCVLAYADDLVLVARDPVVLRSLLFAASRAADWRGLSFKAAKCASLHLDFMHMPQRPVRTEFHIQGAPMRILKDGENYKYLGSPIGFRTDAAPSETLANLRRDALRLQNSELAPWQKIDAMLVFLLPRLEFALRVTLVSCHFLVSL